MLRTGLIQCLLQGRGLSAGVGICASLRASDNFAEALSQHNQSVQQQSWRTATKKAGGTARQNPDTPSRNLGIKFTEDEFVFPGQIIVRQRGTKWHPGWNVGLGKDHTIFAKSVGRVRYSKETVTYASGRSKDRTVVSVVPVNGDWSPEYSSLEQEMIARRAQIKRQLLRARAHEAALHFPLSNPSIAAMKAHRAAVAAALAAPAPKAVAGGKQKAG